jgi:hypothetical protein
MNIVTYTVCTMYHTHKKVGRGSVTSNKLNNISTGSDAFFVSPRSEKPQVLVPDPNLGSLSFNPI